ncbi:MAG: vWA domain-containing protein [Pseudomonadota bacterium]
MKRIVLPVLLITAVIGWIAWEETGGPGLLIPAEPITPNWAAIAAWPSLDTPAVEATPDPGRRITAIVLDDSGSMSGQMDAAKGAVLGALEAMADSDRVAVIALNAGVVQDFVPVSEARENLPIALRPIRDTGTTPLTGAVARARALLEEEASGARGFGTYRIIVTTDGQADEPNALTAEIESLAQATPIQLTTIGLDVSSRHVLRRSDLGSFVDISDVSALQDALQAAVAENTDFTAITDFEGQ